MIDRRRAAGVNQVRRHSAQAVAVYRAGRYVVCVAAAFDVEVRAAAGAGFTLILGVTNCAQ
jgi:hypothetical protein